MACLSSSLHFSFLPPSSLLPPPFFLLLPPSPFLLLPPSSSRFFNSSLHPLFFFSSRASVLKDRSGHTVAQFLLRLVTLLELRCLSASSFTPPEIMDETDSRV